MQSDPDAVARIQGALIALVRRANDPRGNRRINAEAGVDVDRASAVLLARIDELEPARLSELADAAGVDISTASRQVSRLVAEGLVERAPDPDDRRAALHHLSDAGATLHRRLVEARRTVFEDLLAEVSPDDRERFADLLEHLVARAEANDHEHPQAPPGLRR